MQQQSDEASLKRNCISGGRARERQGKSCKHDWNSIEAGDAKVSSVATQSVFHWDGIRGKTASWDHSGNIVFFCCNATLCFAACQNVIVKVFKAHFFAMSVQLANKQLKDTKGGYAQFLRENKGEAKVMEEKEKRVKEIEQSTIKAKSKVRARIVNLQQVLWLHIWLPDF